MKTFFELSEPYEGLKVRRLKHSGRLVLYRVINDPPDYWFVMIKNFEPEGRDKVLIEQGLAKSWAAPTWRFAFLALADSKFEELNPFFPETRRIVSAETLEKLRAHQFKPKITA